MEVPEIQVFILVLSQIGGRVLEGEEGADNEGREDETLVPAGDEDEVTDVVVGSVLEDTKAGEAGVELVEDVDVVAEEDQLIPHTEVLIIQGVRDQILGDQEIVDQDLFDEVMIQEVVAKETVDHNLLDPERIDQELLDTSIVQEFVIQELVVHQALRDQELVIQESMNQIIFQELIFIHGSISDVMNHQKRAI